MRLPVVLFLAATCLSAQNLVITPTIARPSVCSATVSHQSIVQTMPVGPMGAGGTFSAQLPPTHGSAIAFTQWSTFLGSTWGRFSFDQQVQVGGLPGNSAAVDFDILLLLSSSQPMPIRVDFGQISFLGATARTPFLLVDFFDDGTAELTRASSGAQSISLLLGPQPLPVRIRMAADASQFYGDIDQEVVMEFRPDWPILCDLVQTGCEFASLLCAPTFHGEVEFDTTLNYLPTALLLGLGAAPTPLPPAYSASPLCTLLPTPNTLWFPVQAAPVQLSIPATLRPLTIWAQAVVLMPNGAATSDGFRVRAF